jgi:hypothetical protein
MSSSAKRKVSHDPREMEPRLRRPSKLNRKHSGSHLEIILTQKKLNYVR